jgi:hypothetical protein
MKKIIIPILVVVLISCKQKDSKSENKEAALKDLVENAKGLNKGAGTFTIDGLDGWENKDATNMGVISSILLSPLENTTDNYRENVNVVTEKVTSSTNLNDYVEYNKNNLGKFLTTSKIVEVTSNTVNGVPAKVVHYTHNLQGFDLDVLAYILMKDNIAYIITCSAKDGKLEKYREDFEKIVSTFKII